MTQLFLEISVHSGDMSNILILSQEYYEIQGIKMLFNYLTDTPVAPLQRDLVEIEEPLCGDVSSLLVRC